MHSEAAAAGGRDLFRGVRGAAEDARRALTRPPPPRSNVRRYRPVAVAADDHTEKNGSPAPRKLYSTGSLSVPQNSTLCLSPALSCYLSCIKEAEEKFAETTGKLEKQREDHPVRGDKDALDCIVS